MMPAQRRGAALAGFEAGGKEVDEVGADEDVLGVASVDGVAGEGGVVAEVFGAGGARGQVPSVPPIQETPTREPRREFGGWRRRLFRLRFGGRG